MPISLISNPPYNMRWKPPALAGFIPQYMGYEIPPESNANMAFVLTALSKIEDKAVILLPNGVLASGNQKEAAIRRQLIDENLLLAVITLPGSMFESTSIPTCILMLDRNKTTRRICLIDLSEACVDEVRDQRGQYGGTSHTGRTYHKTVKVIPREVMEKCVQLINDGQGEPGLCVWVDLDQIASNNYELTPRRYFEIETEIHHRSFEDIAADYNRVIKQKNAIQIKMNRTAAKRLGFDCMDVDRPDLTASFGVVGQKAEKEKYITFSADDGIQIRISTKETIHPLVREFLSHWKQMIMYLNDEENRYLAEFRDALLPELMNGNIEI